jgi:N-acetyl sugar amidotransferase
MDESAVDIVFDAEGVCNYCRDFEKKWRTGTSEVPHAQVSCERLVRAIKNSRKGAKYDCVIGVSGGVDSSYVLYLAKKSGLNPLAVHLDNGWNSELAVHNINSLVTSLDVDLYTHVIDWEENRDLQRSFLSANVIDIEMLMDNAMLALNYQVAREVGTRWILSGSNTATEGMAMPKNWNWLKFDSKNIRAIHKRFGTVPIKTHKLISVPGFLYNRYIRRIDWLPFLDYFDYRKQDALDILQREVGYKPYPYKHYESVFTRFYQGYILPKKFGVDKRRLHLSTLIMTGQMTREIAVVHLASSPYPDQEQMKSDYDFVLKKLGFSVQEFAAYISEPPVPHSHYPSERWLWDGLSALRRRILQISKSGATENQ